MTKPFAPVNAPQLSSRQDKWAEAKTLPKKKKNKSWEREKVNQKLRTANRTDKRKDLCTFDKNF